MMEWSEILYTSFLFSVVVVYVYDFYAFNLNPAILAVRIGWDGVFVGYEYQSVRVVKVTCPLAFSVTYKLMISARQISDFFQRLCCQEVSDALEV